MAISVMENMFALLAFMKFSKLKNTQRRREGKTLDDKSAKHYCAQHVSRLFYSVVFNSTAELLQFQLLLFRIFSS